MSFSDLSGAQPVDPYSDTGAFAVSQPSHMNNREEGRPRGRARTRTHSRSRSRSRTRSRSRSPTHRKRSPPPPPPPKRPGPAPQRQSPTPSNVLGVFGLSIRTQERDLEDEFSRFGRVDKVTIVYDQRSDRSRGFGFIKMASMEDAARCIQELNGLDLHGRRIRVDYSVTERAHAPTPGQYMGHRQARGDSYNGDRGRDRDYRSSRYDRDRYDRDRDHRDRDRDRDAYGRDRDRRSPRRRSPERRSRRSYSRSPPRGTYSSPPAKQEYDQPAASGHPAVANGGEEPIKW